jgi:hypothetical protein
MNSQRGFELYPLARIQRRDADVDDASGPKEDRKGTHTVSNAEFAAEERQRGERPPAGSDDRFYHTRRGQT